MRSSRRGGGKESGGEGWKDRNFRPPNLPFLSPPPRRKFKVAGPKNIPCFLGEGGSKVAINQKGLKRLL